MTLKVADLLIGAKVGWASQDLRMRISGPQQPFCIFELVLAARCKRHLRAVLNEKLCQGIANALTAACDNAGLLGSELNF